MKHVVIVGTGDCAHGLACFFQNNNDSKSGNILQVTKPKLVLDESKDNLFHETSVRLVQIDEALKTADIVILAIPASALRIFVPEYYSRLKDKIIVDATNSSRKGEDLRELLSVTDVKWVKAFNDIGAIDGLTNKVTGKHKIAAKMCSPNTQALQAVKKFAEKSLGFDVKVVPYERYGDIAVNQDSLGTEWLLAGFYMGISFILFQIYNILRHHVSKGYPWYSFPLFVTNKALAWTVLHGMASAQIPGILAHFHDMWYKDSLRTKPKWLRVCLSIRKHVGLLSLWMLLLHIIGSCIFFNEAYLKKFFENPKANNSKLNWMGELSFACGVWGTGMYTIMGVASMPNVASEMTSKQWWFIFGPIAWIALILGTVHTMVQGVENWNNKAEWYGGYPQMTLTSSILPFFVLALKLVQILFWFLGCRKTKTESGSVTTVAKKDFNFASLQEDTSSGGTPESQCSSVSNELENETALVGPHKADAAYQPVKPSTTTDAPLSNSLKKKKKRSSSKIQKKEPNQTGEDKGYPSMKIGELDV